MADARITSYADALLAVARAEGAVGETSDELFRFARAFEASDELQSALTDPHIPAERRQQIVQDLLGGKATDTSAALVAMIVGAGRARDLPAIVDEFVAASARESNRAVAEVRSAIELTDDQRTRLAASLNRSLGLDVEVKVIIDPSVMGGLITQIGDTVIDGSVRHRLAGLRESF